MTGEVRSTICLIARLPKCKKRNLCVFTLYSLVKIVNKNKSVQIENGHALF